MWDAQGRRAGHADSGRSNATTKAPKDSHRASTASTTSVAGVKRGRSPDSEPRRDESDRWPKAADEDDSNESRYLGQNSIAAFLSEETRAGKTPGDGEQDVIRKDIMPILGLQISSDPFPFMSKAHMDKIRHDIAAALPSDREILKTFQIYKQVVQPFWGLLIDIEEFESKLCVYLEDRVSSARHPASEMKGVSVAWLGMLFAVLAVATNYSELGYHKRVATSQAFVHTSFHCLRLSNFLIRPSLESLQALLILGFVLANDMKAEASWALLGLTCRLAQALGLHRGPNENGRLQERPAGDLPRRKLWWAILWQDSLLSLSFDRCPIASLSLTRCQLPLGPTAMSEGFSYCEGMYHLCQKILQSVSNDSTSASPDFNQIIADCMAVENIRQQVYPRYRSKEACKTVQDRLHHFAIRLHTSFVVSVICRPALHRDRSSTMDIAQKNLLAEKCKQNLTETVRMYLKMHSLSVIPTRSWAFTYHSLSSAVLLGILGETKTDPEVRSLQGNLISALSATAVKDQTSGPLPKSDKDIELSGPLSRALIALRNIYEHGWVTDSSRQSSAPDAPPMDEQEQFDQQQQNAAIAMASMQNNGILPPMDYAQQIPMGPGDLQSVEQTLNMSPMDLFDSIFWVYNHGPSANRVQNVDPYATTVDPNSGFDFTQQLYPL
ncbi:hypothetical protein BP6252_12583 [Coleophoma cylindrospora]|uniref:Xylanolytic transcriptional activator regulatory domain-containing protein n=1 Tax=Coleophoma cylindrospora TaxID=1849047 RepID=A0A3D8QCA9_9HELO|nr:hypothetical protein BP6252_12583 [Coleophoma cylindrospora]